MKRQDIWGKRLEERYHRLYGGRDCKEKIERNKKEFLVKGILLLALLCIGIALDLFFDTKEPMGISINRKGELLAIERPSAEEGSRSLQTQAQIHTKKGLVQCEYIITIDPEGDKGAAQEDPILEKPVEEQVKDELRLLISKLNADTAKEKVTLPRKLENGELVTWRRADSSNLPLFVIGALAAALLLYKKRFYRVEKEEKLAAESIVRELPEFINKLVLLLNAGIVINTAFMKVMEDRRKTGGCPSYFYGQLEQISRSVRETNASLDVELRDFAKRSSVKELMRIANIISDNIRKGADLAEKLKKENELLWFARKQQSEEKGRLAETKLTMPLVILLGVLILITIAPALMGI